MDSFALQDSIFSLLTNDVQMLSLLNNPSGNEELNLRCRREDLLVSELSPEAIPFVSFVFIDAQLTNNYLTNNGVLEVNIYTVSRYDAMNIYRRLKELLYSDERYRIIAEGQIPSGISGIFLYRLRLKPIINS